MRSHILGLIAFIVLLLVPRLATAQTPACDALTGEKRALATALMNEQHPYDCCDDSIAECLKTSKCKLPRRLANHICRMAAAGKDKATIERSLSQRATSMMSARPVPIDLNRAERAGEANAPVTLTAYLCARCSYCARLVPKLHKAVTEGSLKGKVKMYAREFPIRGHAGSTEGGMAMVAARRFDKGWTFLLHLYRISDQFDPANLPKCAAEYGMDEARFRALLSDAGVRRELVASKKEGVRNRVNATPTLFINGRKYTGDLDFETVMDVLEEEYDRVTKSK
ncbi:MAG: DsbA family protein [Myxococcota bacterium]